MKFQMCEYHNLQVLVKLSYIHVIRGFFCIRFDFSDSVSLNFMNMSSRMIA